MPDEALVEPTIQIIAASVYPDYHQTVFTVIVPPATHLLRLKAENTGTTDHTGKYVKPEYTEYLLEMPWSIMCVTVLLDKFVHGGESKTRMASNMSKMAFFAEQPTLAYHQTELVSTGLPNQWYHGAACGGTAKYKGKDDSPLNEMIIETLNLYWNSDCNYDLCHGMDMEARLDGWEQNPSDYLDERAALGTIGTIEQFTSYPISKATPDIDDPTKMTYGMFDTRVFTAEPMSIWRDEFLERGSAFALTGVPLELTG